MTVKMTCFHAIPPSQDLGEQVIRLVEENITDLSMLSVPPSNHLYGIYHWALGIEVGLYISRIGRVASEPVELLLAVDDAQAGEVVGFLLYSPVPTHPDACGVNYMAVKQSRRRQGIGSALMQMMIAKYPHAELTCPVNKVPFYQSIGFQVLDSHNTQVVMNTRSYSTTGKMAVLDVSPIYHSSEAKSLHSRLVQRWGLKAMKQAEKQLDRHVAQLERQAKAFVTSIGKIPQIPAE
jgi:GNAT superfamily N-acetyltransferase